MLNTLKLLMFFLVLTCSSQQQQTAQEEPVQDDEAQFQFDENGQELVNQAGSANQSQLGSSQQQFSNSQNMGNIDNAIPELNANGEDISQGANAVQNPPLNNTVASPSENIPIEESINDMQPPLNPAPAVNPVANQAPASAPAPVADAFAAPQVQVIERQYQPPARADELNHRIFHNRETASILPPIRATLWWVGFDYQKKDGYVRVEVVTRGDPKFAVLQEVNQSGQPELLLRFYETDLRPKIRRSINASEFRSPVSFIRMRESELDGYVDVLITLRDAVRPRLYAKQGNVLLTFEIPERYYGNLSMGQGPIERAQVLPIADIRPMIAKGSDMPEALDLAQKFHYPDHSGNAFLSAPTDGGQELAQVPPNLENPAATAPADLYPQQMQQSPLPAAKIPENLATPPAALTQTSPSPESYQNGWGQAALPPVVPSNAQNQAGVMQNPAASLPASSTFAPNPNPYGAPAAAPVEQTPVNARAYPQVGTESEGFVNYVPQESNANSEDVELKIDDLNNGDNFFENDGLDDFDDGYGDFKDPASKFEVQQAPHSSKYWVTLASSQILTVGQDNGGEDFDDFSNVEDYSLENPASGQNNFANSMNKVQGSDNLYSNPANPATAPAANAPAANLVNPASTTYANPSAVVNAQGQSNPVPTNAVPAEPALPAAAPTNATMNATANTGFSAPGSANLPSNAAPINQASVGAQEVYPSNEAGQSEPAYTYRPENPTERLISVSFKEMPLDYVMKIIMEESKINYIMHPNIQKTPVTIEIHDEPWSLALKAILETHSLGFVELSPTLVRIDTLENLNKEKEMLESIRQKAVNLTPPKTLVHRLSFAKAEDALKQGTALLNAEKHGPFKISADVRTNSIVLNAIPTTLAMMQEIFKRIDLPTPQVDIATRVIEVTDDFTKDFGIGWRSPFHYDLGHGMRAGTLTLPNSATGDFAIDATLGKSIAQLPIKFGSMNNAIELDLALQFGKSNRTVEILQNTNVVVQDNQEAEITTGKIDSFFTFGAEGENERTIEYTLGLKVTPQITANGMVNMKLEIASNDPAQPLPGADASRMTKMIKTMSMRRSGETAVIGGLYTKNKSNSSVGVPFLSDLPIIGALFRSSQETDSKREIMVMITPTVQVIGTSYDQQVPDPVGVSAAPDFASNSSGNILNMAANTSGNTTANPAASQANASSTQSQNAANEQLGLNEAASEDEFSEQEFNNVEFQENNAQGTNAAQQGNATAQQQAPQQNGGQQGNVVNFQNQQEISNQGTTQENVSAPEAVEEEFDE